MRKIAVSIGLITLMLSGCGLSQLSIGSLTKVSKQPRFIDASSHPKVKKEAILQLDTKGYTGVVGNIIVTKNKEIIASDDKAIRVWDRYGKEKRKILGQIGNGNEGTISAMALSSNEQYLAVGGFLDKNDGRDVGNIRIYHYPTGKLYRLLKAHANSVLDLSFSSDGRYLISGSSDTTAKIWDVENNFQLKNTISFHTQDVYAVKIIKTANVYYAVTAGFDNKIALYSLGKSKVIKSDKEAFKLQYLTISEEHIAVCGDGQEIQIYDHSLNAVKRIHNKTKPAGIAYSKDGKLLIAGSRTDPHSINIYMAKEDYQRKSTFVQRNINVLGRVNFLDADTVVSGDIGGFKMWDINNGRLKQKIEGDGRVVSRVGVEGDKIALEHLLDWEDLTIVRKSFNLKNFTISNIQKNENFQGIRTVNGNYTLSHRGGGNYGYSNAVLDIKKDGVTITSITKDRYNGYGHTCYGWYKDLVISGGMHGYLEIYTKDGVKIATLTGHTGAVTSIALEGDRLISGGSDKKIMVWDLSKLTKKEIKIDEVFVSEMVRMTGLTREQVISQARLIQEKSGKNIYISDIQTMTPILNLFISKDDEWVAWTNEGFFNASKNGAKYVGYHINQGPNKEAEYLSVDKFYDIYYRPDLITKALNGESLEQYAKNINIEKLLINGLAPSVAIETSSQKSKKRDITLNLKVCEKDGGYDNLTLFLNGMAVDVLGNDRGIKIQRKATIQETCFRFDKLISLQNGENVIGFKATNKAGNIESNLDEIKVTFKGRSSQKPNLYLLAIGVDKYRDGDLWLKYSKADAMDFTKTISTVSKPLFENIYTYKLLDQDVTKEKILKTFETIGSKTTREDVFMLYLAGHGITDSKTGAYFYLPVDFRYKNENSVREKGLSQNDFKLALSKIQAMKTLTILDTCNSGSFAEALASRGVLQKTAINKLTRATGRATIVASSKDQVALEGYKGHGVFTYTLMEALNGQGYGQDNKITIKELATYIEEILPDRTYEKWGYEQIPQSNITGNDFPIGVK